VGKDVQRKNKKIIKVIMTLKVCHLTTVHPRFDIRIFQKECVSLSEAGYDVSLIVADGQGDTERSGVHLKDIGKTTSRLKRLFVSSYKCYKMALKINATVYHVHDPELLFVATFLKYKGYKVIFDSHELTGKQIKHKYYIPKIVRATISHIYEFLELRICTKLDAVVVPQEHLMVNYFSQSNDLTVVVHNYVDLTECPESLNREAIKAKSVIKLLYSGSISRDRGLGNMLSLIATMDDRFQLLLAGSFSNSMDLDYAKNHIGWSRVSFKGLLNRHDLKKVYEEADIGLIPFNPVGQYLDSTAPLKLFEYMLFGLPVITPDFGSWPEFQKKYNATYPVNCKDSEAFKTEVLKIVEDDIQYLQVVKSSREIVINNYSWPVAESALFKLYKTLLVEDK